MIGYFTIQRYKGGVLLYEERVENKITGEGFKGVTFYEKPSGVSFFPPSEQSHQADPVETRSAGR